MFENLKNKKIVEDPKPLKGDKFLIDEIERRKREKPNDLTTGYSEDIYQKNIDELKGGFDPKGDKEGRPMKPFVSVEEIKDVPDVDEGEDEDEEPINPEDMEVVYAKLIDEKRKKEEIKMDRYTKAEIKQMAKEIERLDKESISGAEGEKGTIHVGPDVEKILIKKKQDKHEKKVLKKKKKLIKKTPSVTDMPQKKIILKREFQD